MRTLRLRPPPRTVLMARRWFNPLVRCAVYLYFAAGVALLVGDGWVSILRYRADKALAAEFLVITAVGVFALLGFGNWAHFNKPLNRRKWILLCLLSSLGILELIIAPTSFGGS